MQLETMIMIRSGSGTLRLRFQAGDFRNRAQAVTSSSFLPNEMLYAELDSKVTIARLVACGCSLGYTGNVFSVLPVRLCGGPRHGVSEVLSESLHPQPMIIVIDQIKSVVTVTVAARGGDHWSGHYLPDCSSLRVRPGRAGARACEPEPDAEEGGDEDDHDADQLEPAGTGSPGRAESAWHGTRVAPLKL
eukprot:3934894-Rhodomonas_salina.4